MLSKLFLPVLMLLAGFASFASLAPTAQAANLQYYWKAGYYLDNGWLCYGWANGAYHCTQHWHTDATGKLISDNPSWVPNGLPSGPVSNPAKPPSTPSAPATPPAGSGNAGSSSPAAFTRGEPCQSTDFWAANISQWTVPPSCYGAVYYPNPANYVSRPSYGWCNWWPEVMHPELPGVAALYRPDHATPVPGATVFFSGGVQGASSDGHFALVIATRPGSQWVLVAEMNFYWRGAGWQKVDYRYIHTGPGVSFRY